MFCLFCLFWRRGCVFGSRTGWDGLLDPLTQCAPSPVSFLFCCRIRRVPMNVSWCWMLVACRLLLQTESLVRPLVLPTGQPPLSNRLRSPASTACRRASSRRSRDSQGSPDSLSLSSSRYTTKKRDLFPVYFSPRWCAVVSCFMCCLYVVLFVLFDRV